MPSNTFDSPRNAKQLPDIKKLRAKAHKEQTTFAQALEHSNLRAWQVSVFTVSLIVSSNACPQN
jgi:hypothetical protein